MEDVVAPDSWSQVATDIIAQKYFRKAGVPKLLKKLRKKEFLHGFSHLKLIQKI